MENTINERFKLVVEDYIKKELGVNKGNLASFLGLKPSLFSEILNCRTNLSIETASKFLSMYPMIDTMWLLTGQGSMLKESNTPEPAEKLIATADLQPIPLVSVTAVGGFGNNSFAIQERDVKDYYVIPKFKHKKVDFMIEVEGSSMYPKYNSGDVVACNIINENTFIQWNKTHVIATKEQGIIIKRIKKGTSEDTLCLISDNKDYDPFEVPKDEITGIALVVGVIRLE